MDQFGKVWMTAGLLLFLNIPLFLFSQTFNTDIINDQINWELWLIEAEWTWGTADILDPDATPVFGDVPDHEPSFLVSAAASSNAVPDQVNAGNICIQWNGVPTTTYSGNILIKTQLNTSYAGIDVDYRSWEDDAGARCSLDSEDDDFMRIQKYYSLGISSPIGGLWTLAPETFSNGSSSTVRYYWHYANGNTLDNPLNFGTLDGFVDHVNTNAGAPSGLSNAADFAYSSQYSGPNYQSSADVIYQFTIDEPRSVTISTNNPTTNFDTYLHLLDASNNYITSNNNASGTTKSTIAGKRLCSGTYKVVVEGNGGSTGTFSLNISLGSIPPFNGGTIVEPAYTVMQQGQSLPTLLNDALPATTVDVSYTWELSQDGGAWTTIPNAVGTSLDPGPFVGCSMSFRRKAYFCTDDMAAYSNTVTFTKITDLLGGTIASEGSLFACPNGKLPNIVSVTPANLNFATYRWQYHLGGNWQALNGETGLNLTTGTLPGSTPIYYRRVATICGQDYPSNVITFRKYLSTDTDGPIYVNDNASGSNNGSSWANAYTQLQYAIDEAECTGAPVWVAAGTYQPTVGVTGSDFGRNNTFFITEDIEIYGGFAGNESSLEQRDYTLNRTILSGDFSQNDIAGLTQDALISHSNRQDNAFHVMVLHQVSSSCIVDGLEFTGGNFNFNPSADNIGGGAIFIIGSTLAATPLIRNCSFYDNSSFEFGGAIFNQSVNSNANPIFTNCTFDNNWASISGGAVANQANKPDGASSSSPTFEYCRFTGNGAAAKGGAIYNDPVNANSISSPIISSCEFFGNTAGEQGGAIHNFGSQGESTPRIVNTIFVDNTGGYRGGAIYNLVNTLNGNTEITNCSFYNNTVSVQGGAIYNLSGAGNSAPSLLITNTILWNNGAQEQIPLRNSGFGKTVLNYSIFDDGTIDNGAPVLPSRTTGSNNLDSDPLFVDALNSDFQLLGASPAIDMGDDTAIPAGITTDLAGNDRVIGSSVDMGAYESTCASPALAVFVDIDAPPGGDGQSWATAFRDLQDGIDLARNCGKPVWVAEGTYYPTRIFEGINSAGVEENYIKTFYIDRNIQLYGGFAGTEASLEERDVEQYVTILSGNFDATTVDALKVMYIDGSTGSAITNDCVIDGFSITGGNAQYSLGFDDNGGGIKLDGNGANSVCSPSILHCKFFANRASNFGGAISVDGRNGGESAPRISYCTFDENESFSGSGGAISVLGNSPVELFGCTFTNNMASSDGGAIATFEGVEGIRIDRCTFENNQAGLYGGAISLARPSSGDPLIRNSIFSNNEAEVGGGAVFYIALGLGGNPQFTNCLYYQNTTNGVGGAIYLETASSLSQPSFSQCTFYGNNSFITTGGAIYNYAILSGVDNITFLNNCILWNNQDEIFNDEAATTILYYSLFDDGNPDGTLNFPAVVLGPGNLDGDPLFVDPVNGDFRLQMSSPAINAGDNSAIPVGVSTDLDGNNRVVGIIVDMGAYENTTPLAPFECASILDFEAPATTTAFQYFANDNLSDQPTPTIANPAPDATNASGTVLAFTKTAAGQTFAGAFPHPDPSRSLDFTDADQLCVKVLMDHPGNITLKLEYSSTGGGNWIQTVENTVINEWVELCFDVSANSLEAPFEAAAGHNYHRVTLFPDFGFPGTGVDVTTYFDDIKVCNSGDGLCGDEYLDVGGGDLTSGTYRGEITLTSSNTIVEGPVVFTAGQSITLQAGFHAGPGLAFHAKIEDCIPAPNPNILEEIEVPNERRILSGQLEMTVYPNPSSFETNIAFHLSASGRTSLEVYHSTGTLLQRLLDQEVMEAGEYTRQLQTTAWESGMYLVVLRSAGSTLVKKIMVVR